MHTLRCPNHYLPSPRQDAHRMHAGRPAGSSAPSRGWAQCAATTPARIGFGALSAESDERGSVLHL